MLLVWPTRETPRWVIYTTYIIDTRLQLLMHWTGTIWGLTVILLTHLTHNSSNRFRAASTWGWFLILNSLLWLSVMLQQRLGTPTTISSKHFVGIALSHTSPPIYHIFWNHALCFFTLIGEADGNWRKSLFSGRSLLWNAFPCEGMFYVLLPAISSLYQPYFTLLNVYVMLLCPGSWFWLCSSMC